MEPPLSSLESAFLADMLHVTVCSMLVSLHQGNSGRPVVRFENRARLGCALPTVVEVCALRPLTGGHAVREVLPVCWFPSCYASWAGSRFLVLPRGLVLLSWDVCCSLLSLAVRLPLSPQQERIPEALLAFSFAVHESEVTTTLWHRTVSVQPHPATCCHHPGHAPGKPCEGERGRSSRNGISLVLVRHVWCELNSQGVGPST